MVVGLPSSTESQGIESLLAQWNAILQKNSKSEAQLQAEMISGVSEKIEEIKEKREEETEEATDSFVKSSEIEEVSVELPEINTSAPVDIEV